MKGTRKPHATAVSVPGPNLFSVVRATRAAFHGGGNDWLSLNQVKDNGLALGDGGTNRPNVQDSERFRWSIQVSRSSGR